MRSDWTLPDAVNQVAYGDPKTRQTMDSQRTEDAADWIYEFIAEQVADQHPLMLGAIAESLLDALQKRK